MGPSSTMTTRKQRLRRFHDDLGMCLETTTQVKGVPVADTFFVDDKWILEAKGETRVSLTVRHETRFVKRTMFKRVILITSNKQVTTWYDGYTAMLKSALHAKEEVPVEKLATAVELPAGRSMWRKAEEKLANNAWLLLFAFFLLLLRSFILDRRMCAVQTELEQLREDLSKLLVVLER